MECIQYSALETRLSGTTHLLLGNGFSISCDPAFDYTNLYETAKARGLPERVQTLFEHHGTNNFEAVLRTLSELTALSGPYPPLANVPGLAQNLSEDYDALKEALISAVADNHLDNTGRLETRKKATCADFLSPYHSIYTTNYDLLLYWVEMAAIQQLKGRDGFSRDLEAPDAPYCVFSQPMGSQKGLYFLHGALHLYAHGGEVRKHVWEGTGTPLMDSIRNALNERQFPLFVAEGEPDKKVEQIERSSYLSYCYGKFKRLQSPLVTLGFSFGSSDNHIKEAIARNPKLEKIYVGLYEPDSPSARETIKQTKTLQSRREKMNSLLPERAKKKAAPLDIVYWDTASAQVWS